MTTQPYRVLILCTGNTARSQIAEALFNARGAGKVVAESAGSHPALQVNPRAIAALADAGITWNGHPPRGLDGLEPQRWDFVITVCDNAKESCPIFPGHTVVAHWGMPDPADVRGTPQEEERAFHETLLLLRRRIDLFLALPMEKLDLLARTSQVRGIGEVGRTEESAR